MFIFARCLRRSAAVTPAKFELDIIQVTTVLIIRKKWENNGTGKIGLVTPIPGGELLALPSRVGDTMVVLNLVDGQDLYPETIQAREEGLLQWVIYNTALRDCLIVREGCLLPGIRGSPLRYVSGLGATRLEHKSIKYYRSLISDCFQFPQLSEGQAT